MAISMSCHNETNDGGNESRIGLSVKALIGKEIMTPYSESTYLALWCAAEMVHRSMSAYLGMLQKLVAKNMEAKIASQILQDVFCKFRLSLAYKTN